jgi:hypothetical protein
MEFDYLLYTNHFLTKTQLIVGITEVKIEFIHSSNFLAMTAKYFRGKFLHVSVDNLLQFR